MDPGPDPDLPWREIHGPGFNAHIGPILFAELGGGRFAAALELRAEHLNVGGVCHGGVLMSFADTAMGTASYVAGQSHPCATIAFEAQFLAAARPGQRLTAEARQLRRVSGLSFMDCAVWAGGRQVLHASGIWKYLDSRAPQAPAG